MAETSAGRTALITGVCGQDGTLLAEHLLALGYRVIGVARRRTAEQGGSLNGIHRVEADVCEASLFPLLLSDYRPEEVYHLAAFHHSTEDNARHADVQSKTAMVGTNFQSTAALAFAVLEADIPCHLVFAASS